MLFNGKVFVPLPHKAKQSASFSPNGNLRTPCLRKRDMKVKVGNVVQLFPRYHSADFCHIPPSRFSQDLRCRISTRGLRFQYKVETKKLYVIIELSLNSATL